MTTIIIGAVLAIGVLGALASVFKHYNAPKTLEEQRKIDEAKAKAADERRADMAARIEARRAEQEKKRAEREANKKPRRRNQ